MKNNLIEKGCRGQQAAANASLWNQKNKPIDDEGDVNSFVYLIV